MTLRAPYILFLNLPADPTEIADNIRRKLDFRRGRRLGRGEQIVLWRRPMTQETYEETPESLTARFNVRPLLIETLVDPHRYQGTCYRAANWIPLGTTSGRGRMDRTYQRHDQAPKSIFVYPLHHAARERLRGAHDSLA